MIGFFFVIGFRSHSSSDHQKSIDVQPLLVKKHGTDFGLAVIIDHLPDEYAYMIDSFIGMKVLIFDTQNFPDIYNGAVQEQITVPEEEMFLTFHPVVINGSHSMKQFNAASRHCVFTDEINLIYKECDTVNFICRRYGPKNHSIPLSSCIF